jgi:hypothetical protein
MRPVGWRWQWGGIAFVAALGSAAPGRAQAQQATSNTAKVAAETLFEEGRRLMADGKATEACPKFAESQRLDPSPGTLLNLASCYEKSGRPATAWATYREGASSASATGRQDLLATAQRHAEALLPSLPRLSLSVTGPADGLSVALDGVAVGRAEWGMAVPVDPGDHTVDATAAHFKPWSTKLTVSKDPTTTTVTVPVLEAAPADAPPSPETPSPAPPMTAPPASTGGDPGSTQRMVGIVVGAVGIVGLGVGAGFAFGANSAYKGSLSDCLPNTPNECSAAGVSQRNNALSLGNIATGFVIGGAVAAAGGVVLWLTAPSARKTGQAGGAVRSADRLSLALLPNMQPGGVGGASAIMRGAW